MSMHNDYQDATFTGVVRTFVKPPSAEAKDYFKDGNNRLAFNFKRGALLFSQLDCKFRDTNPRIFRTLNGSSQNVKIRCIGKAAEDYVHDAIGSRPPPTTVAYSGIAQDIWNNKCGVGAFQPVTFRLPKEDDFWGVPTSDVNARKVGQVRPVLEVYNPIDLVNLTPPSPSSGGGLAHGDIVTYAETTEDKINVQLAKTINYIRTHHTADDDVNVFKALGFIIQTCITKSHQQCIGVTMNSANMGEPVEIILSN
jgi:hypothetical protein